MEEETPIPVKPVRKRTDGGNKLWGWTFAEWGVLIGAAALVQWLFGSKIITGVAIAGAWYYLREIAAHQPERFLANLYHHTLRKHWHYRATAPDTEWRSPVRR